MKNNGILYIVAGNLAALILLAIFLPHLMISPGKLIDAHIELRTDCFACHTPFSGSTPDKCVACHKVAEIGIRTTKGLAIDKEKKNVAFHQKLAEDNCVACHSDHKGVQAFRPIDQFSHKLLEPEIEKQCDGCHANPGDALHRKITANCSSCHTQQSWTPATFDHDKYFRFDREHTTECITCHINEDYSNYTCYGCHEHSRSKIREEHVEEGIYKYESCVDCHRSGDEDEAEYIWNRKRREQETNRQRREKRYYREHEKRHNQNDDD